MSASPELGRARLEVISDAEGAVVVGWLNERVLYARLEGGLSAELGASYASRLQQLATARQAFEFFQDAHGLVQYDLLARSAFVRVVLANRRRFKALTLLTWAEGLGVTAHSMMASIGGAVEMLTEPGEFQQRLMQAAPGAMHLLKNSRR